MTTMTLAMTMTMMTRMPMTTLTMTMTTMTMTMMTNLGRKGTSKEEGDLSYSGDKTGLVTLPMGLGHTCSSPTSFR